MAYRGGRSGAGRGRGRFGYSHRIAGKQFVLFPEDVELPDRNAVTVEMDLINRNLRLLKFWKYSPYFIKEAHKKESERPPDIERYSDMTKPRSKSKSDDLWQIIKPTHLSFPLELIKDGKGCTRPLKKVRWNPDAEMQKLDLFEKLEQRYQELAEKGVNKKKEGESEDEPEEEVEEDEEFSDDGDYNQNIEFDDDEDDYNMEDDGDDEPTY